MTNRGENGDELEIGGKEQRRKNGPLRAGTMRFIGKSLVPVGVSNRTPTGTRDSSLILVGDSNLD
jgi:hypothetical protein